MGLAAERSRRSNFFYRFAAPLLRPSRRGSELSFRNRAD